MSEQKYAPSERLIEIEKFLKRQKLICGEASQMSDEGTSANVLRAQAFSMLYIASALERICTMYGQLTSVPDLDPPKDAEFFVWFGTKFRRTGETRVVQAGEWHCPQEPRCMGAFNPESPHVCEILERVEE